MATKPATTGKNLLSQLTLAEIEDLLKQKQLEEYEKSLKNLEPMKKEYAELQAKAQELLTKIQAVDATFGMGAVASTAAIKKVLKSNPNTAMTAEEIAEKSKIDVATVTKLLDGNASKGDKAYVTKTKDGAYQYHQTVKAA